MTSIHGKLTFLGTGTSTGVPQIGCTCPVCKSKDPRDRRMRSSALIEIGDVRLLIDCGPDFYSQMISLPFRPIDGILITHEHYDHVGGIDDLRPFCKFGTIDIYANELTYNHLKERIPYCFAEHLYRGVPHLNLIKIIPDKEFSVKGISVMPLRVMHGKMEILGYRIGDLAYITDMTLLPHSEMKYLSGVSVLVVNALRHSPHPTHQSVEEAIDFAYEVGAEHTYFTHMSHEVGLHAVENLRLPENMFFAYDGLVLNF